MPGSIRAGGWNSPKAGTHVGRGMAFGQRAVFNAKLHRGASSFCAQVAEMEVDSETGEITVNRIVTSHDVGTIFNPLGHQGQIDGAVIQGLGFALMEELQSEDGCISTLSLGDVKILAIADVPELVTVLVESADGTGSY